MSFSIKEFWKRNRLFKCNLSFLILAFILISCGNSNEKEFVLSENLTIKKHLIYSDEFNEELGNWIWEQQPNGTVFYNNGKLEINDANGCTVWFRNKLKGPLMIEYQATVIDLGGQNDRVSDLNCFWMAMDNENPQNIFAKSNIRKGKFANYDSLSLYYVGVGGHGNTKTRFRRYSGNGEKPILPEHDLSEAEYLIKPNFTNQIRLIAYHETIKYYINEKLIFDYQDDQPYTEGYFGLRTFHNHMTVDNFKVFRLTEIEN